MVEKLVLIMDFLPISEMTSSLPTDVNAQFLSTNNAMELRHEHHNRCVIF